MYLFNKLFMFYLKYIVICFYVLIVMYKEKFGLVIFIYIDKCVLYVFNVV